MVDDKDKKEDSFEFDSAGEAAGYISMAQARVLAMRTAREKPGNYGAAFEGIQMVFEVADAEQDSEEEGGLFHIRLSYRPEGNFQGQSGVEEFILTDVGEMEIRQVLSWPVGESITPNVLSTPQPVDLGCPRCGAANEPGSVYCFQCGLPLDEESQPRSGTSSVSAHVYRSPRTRAI